MDMILHTNTGRGATPLKEAPHAPWMARGADMCTAELQRTVPVVAERGVADALRGFGTVVLLPNPGQANYRRQSYALLFIVIFIVPQ